MNFLLLNEFGSEGPKAKRQPKPISSNEVHKEEETGRDNDPAPPVWRDLVSLPPVEEYMLFNSPPEYSIAMRKDSGRWATSCDIPAMLAITNITSRLIMPRLVDLNQWKAVVSSFLGRLCRHRRTTLATAAQMTMSQMVR